MTDFRLLPSTLRSVAVVLALGLPLQIQAQDAPAAPQTPAADAPAEQGAGTDFNPGVEVAPDGTAPEAGGVGENYIAETTGDWEVRCIRTSDGFDPCQLYQLLKDDKGNNVAEFSLVALPEGSEAAAGATVITPLETLLTAQLTLIVDGGKAKRYPYTWCSKVGCFSRIGFTGAEVAQLKKGAKATVVIVPMLAPDQKVNLTVSLAGFTAGFEKMKAMNEETQKRADAAQKAAEEKAAKDGTAPAASAN